MDQLLEILLLVKSVKKKNYEKQVKKTKKIIKTLSDAAKPERLKITGINIDLCPLISEM